ncbi:MAG TPA: mechanosensitive ion channel family protein [Gemmatimonadaceae bacterium]|jgi:small-conductance mechanosensitive channel
MDFLDRILAIVNANSPRAWITAAAILIAIAGALFALKTLMSRRLATIALRSATQVDDAFVAVFGATNVLFIVVIALHAATSVLTLPTGAVTTMRAVTIVAIALQFGLWGGTGVRAFTTGYLRRHTESASRTAVFAVGFLAQAVVWSFVLVATLNAFGYDVTALVAGLGITGVAIALAVQNILGDLFAALSIVVDKPFVVGETIDVAGQVGTVERIGLKTTRVRALQGEEVVYSNAELLKTRLHNYSRMRERRLVMTLSVTYETPPATVARIPGMIREAILAQPNVRFDRAHLAKFAESSLDYEFVFYALDPDYNVGMDLKQAVYVALLRRFESEGVSLAYPTRVIIQRPRESSDPNEVRSESSHRPR